MINGSSLRMVVLLGLAVLASGCGSGTDDKQLRVRLGVAPNVTHAPGLIAIGKGYLAEQLPGQRLETSGFPSGTTMVEALFSQAIDAAYLGPNPAINGYFQSSGDALVIVSGVTSGGAALVVRPDITRPEQLRGTTIGSPSLGNTQDVALRAWLRDQGLATDSAGGGDVSVLPQDNAQSLQTFRTGSIAGAWVPEPWVSRLVSEGGGRILVDEKDLWPAGRFTTTQLVVSPRFLAEHPESVRGLVRANLQAIDFAGSHPREAKRLVNDQIEAFTGKRLKETILESAWKGLTFTPDPVAQTLRRSADDAVSVGLLQPVPNLAGIYKLDILNALLTSKGRATVKGLA